MENKAGIHVKSFGGILVSLLFLLSAHGENWPSFRGGNALGLSGTEGPLHWDIKSGKNIRWKASVSGLGLSSPVIDDGKIFLTTAVAEKGDAELKVGLYGNISSAEDDGVHSWRVLCIDSATGSILWDREVKKGKPQIRRHTKASHANCTIATDGKHVVAFFGSEGLFCLDTKGKVLWEKSLGTLDAGFFMVPTAQWGFASSPIIHEGRIILQCDVQKQSFVTALDVTTGEEIWKTLRTEVPTWGSPCLIEHEGKKQIILNGFQHIGSYNFEDGKEIWNLKGGGDIPVPTPIFSHGLIYITNAHGAMSPLYAVRPDARGTLTVNPSDESASEGIAWWYRRGGNYMQTPIVIGANLYLCSDSGVISCYNAKSGEGKFRERLRKGKSGFGFTASPVSDGSKIYFCTEDGYVIIVKAGDSLEILAKNEIGEKCMATPALADGVLYVRARNHLFAIGEAK